MLGNSKRLKDAGALAQHAPLREQVPDEPSTGDVAPARACRTLRLAYSNIEISKHPKLQALLPFIGC